MRTQLHPVTETVHASLGPAQKPLHSGTSAWPQGTLRQPHDPVPVTAPHCVPGPHDPVQRRESARAQPHGSFDSPAFAPSASGRPNSARGRSSGARMTPQEPNRAPLPYRWGRFEGWLLVLWSTLAILGLGAALLIRVRRAGGLAASGLGPAAVPLLVFVVAACAASFLMGRGLLGKRYYALQ